MNFQQLCEFLTHKQKYLWFYIDDWVLELFSEEDKSIAKIEKLNDGFIRAFYPANKWKPPVTTLEDLQAQLKAAFDRNDFERIAALGKTIREIKNK